MASAATLVFAAASLEGALDEVAAAWRARGQQPVEFNYAGSNVLARQIEAGAPADLFFSADLASMDRVARFLEPATRRNALGNTLVVIAPVDNPAGVGRLADLAGAKVHRLALGDPAAVPAGLYARRLLESHQLWKAVEPKVAPAENVRAALEMVAQGNAEAGIVYATDVAGRKAGAVKVVFSASGSDAPEIRYPVAVLHDAPHRDEALAFSRFLASPESAAIFRRRGFVIPSERR